jgi:ParB-like chromosome segregation protein Spo0J
MKIKTTRRAAKKPRYEPVLKLPPLPYEQFVALRDNIAIHGVLVPILVDSDGPRRKIIDGNYRQAIADELGYDCPEIVQGDLTDEEKHTLARALNLARRQLTQEQKRQLIADQLEETPGMSNRWVGKQLGVHHATVAAVRGEMERTGQIDQFERTVGNDGKQRPASKPTPKVVTRTEAEGQARLKATTLLHGDCRVKLKEIASGSIDAIITDPIYPEVSREYGKISEAQWHDLMRAVLAECRRGLKPKGSAVFILGPNSERVGKMRLWLWEFVAWAGGEWNLVQDAYWWAVDTLPLGGIKRHQGLMRPSVKMCVWLGPSDCYRNQQAVLLTPSEATSARHRSDVFLRTGPSGKTYRNSTIAKAADERGGTTPFNCLPVPLGAHSGTGHQHPAATPYDLAAWWCRYILPEQGVLLDPFCGTGNVLLAGLDHGASGVIGIDKEKKYLETGRKRIVQP